MIKKFAVFDIDGTLIRWQLYHTIVDRLAKKEVLKPKAYKAVKEARMRWKRREDAESFHRYEMILIEAYHRAITNTSTKQFDDLVSGVINEYRDQVYTYTRDLIKDLKAKKYTLIAISGSHHELVQQIADYYGFDIFIGTKYERKNGIFTGERFAVSVDKKTALKTLIKEHGLSIKDSLAIGDSFSDAAMLEEVENPIAFNPEKRLFDIAKARGWKIVIERKNMTYELRVKNGTYVLAQARSY